MQVNKIKHFDFVGRRKRARGDYAARRPLNVCGRVKGFLLLLLLLSELLLADSQRMRAEMLVTWRAGEELLLAGPRTRLSLLFSSL